MAPAPEKAPSIPWMERLHWKRLLSALSLSTAFQNARSAPGVAHAGHEDVRLVLADGDLGTDGRLEVGDGDIAVRRNKKPLVPEGRRKREIRYAHDVVPGLLLSSEGSDLVVDSGNEDLAGRGNELGEDGEEVGHRLCKWFKTSETHRFVRAWETRAP